MNILKIKFANDNDVEISLPIEHQYTYEYISRPYSEKIFRQINTHLINCGYIKNNIIDLGAWIGDNTIPWAMNIAGTVYAIDPSEENCKFIQKLQEINRVQNVVRIQKVISNKNTVVSTNHFDLHHCEFVADDSMPNKIEAYSLDNLFEENIITDVGYIHLDVEGMEGLILEGSTKLIDEYRPIISFEQHLDSDNYGVICKKLKNKNYIVYLINEILVGCRADCRNFIALPTETHPENFLKHIASALGECNRLTLM